ncbi:hypothetical protein N7491_011365 [Penicillium cf. griseofulvum]|nr:hypothetical protein N7491_011365 [Penicillium cf. griseofulvum]
MGLKQPHFALDFTDCYSVENAYRTISLGWGGKLDTIDLALGRVWAEFQAHGPAHKAHGRAGGQVSPPMGQWAGPWAAHEMPIWLPNCIKLMHNLLT